MARKPIFFDDSGQRAQRMTILGWVGAILSTALGIAVIVSIWATNSGISPDLPIHMIADNALVEKAVKPGLLKSASKLASEARVRHRLAERWRKMEAKSPTQIASHLRPPPGESLAIGFYINTTDEERNALALEDSLPNLDWLVPGWMYVADPSQPFSTALDDKALKLIRSKRPNLPIIPMIQNISHGNWHGAELQKLLAKPAARKDLIAKITAFVAANRFQGVTIDFEDVPRAAHKDLGAFLSELSAVFKPRGWLVLQAVPFDDDEWPYTDYASHVDYTVLMAYDEHDDSSSPGSIAGEPWFENVLDKRFKQLAPSRTIVAIGNYGYDWHGKGADVLRFQDAAIAARYSGARITFDAATNNPHFAYIEDGTTRHEVWFLDAATAFNQIHAADVFQPAGYALWRLGSEDPTIWSVMGRRYNAPAPEDLRTIPTNDDVDFEGYGEILRVEAGPQAGSRRFFTDPDTGDIVDEFYDKLPTSYVIRRVGLVPHKVALTFDDGPDPRWTPEILDILKAKKVPATFFLIGANIEARPELVQRELAEGHEIGNHTFTHPNLAETSPEAVRIELSATQKLFEALTGRSMHLFRPPYLGDAEPSDAREIVPVQVAQKLGYITIGVHVDPMDWQEPTADQMLARIEHAVSLPNLEWRGNIIMLHDSGGNREHTVEVLPALIDKMRAKGFEFVPVSQLAGLTRDQAMPPLAPSIILTIDKFVFIAISWFGQFLYYCFIAAIILGIAKLLCLCVLSLINLRRARKDEIAPPPDMHIPVSVIIPAYNEEKVIAATIQRILACPYADLEIIVVNDGSQDGTSAIVRREFCSDPRVTLLDIENSGKAHALNVGLEHAKGEVVVALDADTQFKRDTIARLVRWFSDPSIGAVAGNAKVGNRINMITRWQALEYIVAQNLERRALAALDTFTVVPGAVGAWRRDAVLSLGGFSADTLAEDQDLTIALQRAGYKVHFDASAIAWTEAPATVRGLARQRFRWAFGTLQCLWKHRDMNLNPRHKALGLVAMPQVWLFQIVLTALAPLADLMLIFQLWSQWLAYSQHGAEYSNNSLYMIGVYYVVFVVVDLAAAVFGFLMEKKEKWSLLWWLMLQRFGYRQIMYYVVVRSIATALRGVFVGWGKLERAGTVNAEH